MRSSALGALCSPRAAARDIRAVCDTGDTEFVCAPRLAAIRELTTSRQGSSRAICLSCPALSLARAVCLLSIHRSHVLGRMLWPEGSEVPGMGRMGCMGRKTRSPSPPAKYGNPSFITLVSVCPRRIPHLDITSLPGDVPTSTAPSSRSSSPLSFRSVNGPFFAPPNYFSVIPSASK